MPAVNPSIALVDIRDLSVSLGGRAVLRSVDLTLPPGRVTTLVGPNGAGKTTLLRAILDLAPPSGGEIRRRPGLRIGYMPQRLMIDRTLPLDVRRFLDLWRSPGGPAALDALETAGATEQARKPVQSLSGGEFQRVLFARALMAAPDLLVLDEPDQALDARGRDDLFRRIDEFASKPDRAVLMVTHDLETALSREDRLFHVDGRIRPATRTRDGITLPRAAELGYGTHG